MSIYKILRMLFRLRHDVKDSEGLFKKIQHRYFPEYDHFGEAIKEAGETLLYADYESKSIEKEAKEVQSKLETVEYELNSVMKSIDRFKNRMATVKSKNK